MSFLCEFSFSTSGLSDYFWLTVVLIEPLLFNPACYRGHMIASLWLFYIGVATLNLVQRFVLGLMICLPEELSHRQKHFLLSFLPSRDSLFLVCFLAFVVASHAIFPQLGRLVR